MTAHAMGGDRDVCLAAGMDGFLPKPFTPVQLNGVLAKLKQHAVADHQDRDNKYIVSSPSASSDKTLTAVTLSSVIEHLQMTTALTVDQCNQVVVAAQRSIKMNLEQAESALFRDNFVVLGQAAHSIKGTLLQFGLHELAAIAEEIYQGTKGDKSRSYAYLLKHLALQLSGLLPHPEGEGRC